MSVLVLTNRAQSALAPVLRGRLVASADVVETTSWAEVTTFTLPQTGTATLSTLIDPSGRDLDVTADVAMRLLVTDQAVAAGSAARGWRIAAGAALTVSLQPGDRIFVRTA